MSPHWGLPQCGQNADAGFVEPPQLAHRIVLPSVSVALASRWGSLSMRGDEGARDLLIRNASHAAAAVPAKDGRVAPSIAAAMRAPEDAESFPPDSAWFKANRVTRLKTNPRRWYTHMPIADAAAHAAHLRPEVDSLHQIGGTDEASPTRRYESATLLG